MKQPENVVKSSHGKGYDDDLVSTMVSEMDGMTRRGITPDQIRVDSDTFRAMEDSPSSPRHMGVNETSASTLCGIPIVIVPDSDE